MESLSRQAPRVSRRNKTGAFPGLLQKANPKPGGDYPHKTPIEHKIGSAIKA
ncbi:hypothetical protein [Planococcus maritimus]|uniref:hypothetical protein n=1 Tax=Planococcus maritimus TaxID=192421 RepID=UPI000AC0FA53|nr:hypothetical protein [Planococcus maritimus]